MIKFIFAFITVFTPTLWAQYSIQGQIFEKGKKVKLSNIKIFILPQKIQAQTNEQGVFEIQDITQKQSQIVINAGGYKRFERPLEFSEVKTDYNVDIFLERDRTSADIEVDVVDSNKQRDQSKKSLSRKQVFEMPGANGDPVKAVQNLPGINRPQGFSSQVIIQGSAPKDTIYDFEGHEIPLVFHFGGLTSVVMPEAVDSVDYYSAGYQSDHSRALGGLISLKTRQPEVTERDHKGLFYVDNLSAGGLYEAKINDHSSYLVAGRYSYIGFFLKNAFKDNKTLDLTVAPEYMDLTSVYMNDLSSTDRLKVSFLASKDRLAFVLDEPLRSNPSVRGNFSNSIYFFRLVPQYSKKVDSDNSYKLSVALGKDAISVDIGDRYFKIDSLALGARGEWDHQISKNHSWQLGWDNDYSRSDVKFKIPVQRGDGGVNNPTTAQDDRFAEVNNFKTNQIGLYARYEVPVAESFKLIPGFRFDRLMQTSESFFLPRLAAQYTLDEYRFIKAAVGKYVQSPEPQESAEQYGNPEVKSPQALHYLLGYEHDFRKGDRWGWNTSVNGFYKQFSNLVIASSETVQRNGETVFEVYNNKGEGKAYGIEISVKKSDDQWTHTLAYTWSKSVRSNPSVGEYNFEYDQTHNFNLISAYEFAENWKLSGRYRYVTGNPNTPVIGSIYDADNEVYFPLRGALYSERNKDFQQLDLRIDKKFILDKEIWSIYLDVQNILNIKNPEGYQYSYDYSSRLEIMGLPTVPALGLRGEF